MPPSVHLFSSGPADQVSGGYHYNARLMDGLKQLGHPVIYHGDQQDLETVAQGDTLIIDGLVLESLGTPLLSHDGPRVALLHMRPDQLPGDTNLSVANHVVVTGESVGEAVRALGVVRDDRLTCIAPAIDDDWRAKSSYAPTPRRLLCLANYLPRKGYERLIDTLASLTDLDWTLTCHGNADFEPTRFEQVRERVENARLGTRIGIERAVSHDRVNLLMCEADLLLQFSVDESYSMVTAEALACGLPVLSHPTGAMREFAPHGTICYVDTEDHVAASDALRDLFTNPQAYARLRPTGLPPRRSWRDVALAFNALLSPL
ncbi:MAG: glycosyltransferase family 4 protein [Pseudomonadota bacterium]